MTKGVTKGVTASISSRFPESRGAWPLQPPGSESSPNRKKKQAPSPGQWHQPTAQDSQLLKASNVLGQSLSEVREPCAHFNIPVFNAP